MPPETTVVAMSSSKGGCFPAGAAKLRGLVPRRALRPKVGTAAGMVLVMVMPIMS